MIDDQHFKITTYGGLADGAIFMAVIQETSVARCLKVIELRHEGEPIDPLPWLAATETKVGG